MSAGGGSGQKQVRAWQGARIHGQLVLHRAPLCRRCLEQRQGVANCCTFGHKGHPLAGAPHGRGQYLSCPDMRKVSHTDLVAATQGIHGWLRRPRPEDDDNDDDDDNGAGDSEQPPRKAAKAVPREVVDRDKRPVSRGQPGEASPRAAEEGEEGGG